MRLPSRSHRRSALSLVSSHPDLFHAPPHSVCPLTGVLPRIRYHLLHPEYIHQRIADLGGNYNLRIILVQCDADNHTAAMKELTKVALVNGYTLMTCWR